MVVIEELQLTSLHDSEMKKNVTRDIDYQDDTIIYVMHGALNRMKVQYINNRNIMNNLD